MATEGNDLSATSEEDELWIDYVSDLGDAIDPTLAVAWQLTRPEISLPTGGLRNLPKPPRTLPRGSLLIMGGDEVYPYASERAYANQLVLPYRLAGDQNLAPNAADSCVATAAPKVVAIPGNHDWLGGIEHFEKIFVESEKFADHWTAPQRHRYWAIELIGNWWIWGIDTGLHDVVDEEQKAFFADAAEALAEGDRVIICSPVPWWQLHEKRKAKYNDLRAWLDDLLATKKADAPLFLAGDSHYFAEYQHVGGAVEQHVTAGGGGAFLQPTHNLVAQVKSGDDPPAFELGASWPRPIDSRALAADVAVLRDRQFRRLFGFVALLHVAFAALVGLRYDTVSSGQPFVQRVSSTIRGVLEAWPGWPMLALLIVGTVAATIPNSKARDLARGARGYGFVHGVAQAAGLVAIASFARLVGPEAAWWRLVVVPLVGGVLSTVVMIAMTGWINRHIRANDTAAYSSAHLTRYKNFVRMSVNSNGDLKLYVVGIDPVGEGWVEALTSPTPSVPPKDRAGERSKLHYVWGRDFIYGSAEKLRELERSLGLNHPDTISSRTERVQVLLKEHKISEAVVVAEQNLAYCSDHYDETDRVTLYNTELLAEALVRRSSPQGAEDPDSPADIDEACRYFSEVLAAQTTSLSDDPGDTDTLRARARVRSRLMAVQYLSRHDDHGVPPADVLDDGDLAERLEDQKVLQDSLVGDALLCGALIEFERTGVADSDTLRALLADCETELGTDHLTSVLVRRLLAQRLADRHQIVQLLREPIRDRKKAHEADRWTLHERRRLAEELAETESDPAVGELRELINEGLAVGRVDRPVQRTLAAPAALRLARELDSNGDSNEAVRVLQNFLNRAAVDLRLLPDVLQELKLLGGELPLEAQPERRRGAGSTEHQSGQRSPQTAHERSPVEYVREGVKGGAILVGASVVIALALVAGVFVLAQDHGKVDSLAGERPVPTVPGAVPVVGPADVVQDEVVQDEIGAAQVVQDEVVATEVLSEKLTAAAMPQSQGRNIVVLPLESSQERLQSSTAQRDPGTEFSNALAASLGDGAEEWAVWGPAQLEEGSIDMSRALEFIQLAEDTGSSDEIDAYLELRNIDVVIFGTLRGTSNSIIELVAWFDNSTNGAAEAGIEGRIELWNNGSRGDTGSIVGLARDLPTERVPLVPFLQALSTFHDARVTSDFVDARALFEDVQSDSFSGGAEFGLNDLATLFIGNTILFVASAIDASDPGDAAADFTNANARIDALKEAEDAFVLAAQSENVEVRSRGHMGNAVKSLLSSQCVGGSWPIEIALEDATTALDLAYAAVRDSDTDIGPHEIVLRLDTVAGNIEFCRWKDTGNSTEVLKVLDRVIATYTGFSDQAKARVAFNVAQSYGQRALVRLGDPTQESAEGPSAMALSDLAHAACLSRNFNGGTWVTRLTALGYTPDCETDKPFAVLTSDG